MSEHEQLTPLCLPLIDIKFCSGTKAARHPVGRFCERFFGEVTSESRYDHANKLGTPIRKKLFSKEAKMYGLFIISTSTIGAPTTL